MHDLPKARTAAEIDHRLSRSPRYQFFLQYCIIDVILNLWPCQYWQFWIETAAQENQLGELINIETEFWHYMVLILIVIVSWPNFWGRCNRGRGTVGTSWNVIRWILRIWVKLRRIKESEALGNLVPLHPMNYTRSKPDCLIATKGLMVGRPIGIINSNAERAVTTIHKQMWINKARAQIFIGLNWIWLKIQRKRIKEWRRTLSWMEWTDVNGIWRDDQSFKLKQNSQW